MVVKLKTHLNQNLSKEQLLVLISAGIYLVSLIIHYFYTHYIDPMYGIMIADQRNFEVRAWGVLNFKVPYRDFYVNAAPLSPYLWGALMVPSTMGGADFSYVLRMFFAITLITSGVLLYRIIDQENSSMVFVITLIYTVNPFFLYLLTFWGSDECLLPFLFLLPIYLFKRGNNTLATIAIVVGAGLKYFPVILAPLIWYYTRSWFERIKESVIFGGTLLGATLPFYFADKEKFLKQFEDPVGEGGNQGIHTVVEYALHINLDQYSFALLIVCLGVLAVISLIIFFKRENFSYYHSLAIIMAFLIFYKKIQASYWTMAYPFIFALIIHKARGRKIGLLWMILSFGYGEVANYLIRGGTKKLLNLGAWTYVVLFYVVAMTLTILVTLDTIKPQQTAPINGETEK